MEDFSELNLLARSPPVSKRSKPDQYVRKYDAKTVKELVAADQLQIQSMWRKCPQYFDGSMGLVAPALTEKLDRRARISGRPKRKNDSWRGT